MAHELEARCPACLSEEQEAREAFEARDVAAAKLAGVQAKRKTLAGEVASVKALAESEKEAITAIKPILSATFESLDTAASEQDASLQGQAQSDVRGSIELYKTERTTRLKSLTSLVSRLKALQESLANIDMEEEAAQQELDSLESEAQTALEALSSCNAENCGSSNVSEEETPKAFSSTLSIDGKEKTEETSVSDDSADDTSADVSDDADSAGDTTDNGGN